MPQTQTQAPSGEGKIPALEKIFEEERERDRFEYRVYAKFDDDIAERVDVSIVYYPMKRYGNNVTLNLTMYLENGLNLEVRKVRNSWGGSGLDFRNTIRIFTTQEFDDTVVLGRERYEKMSSVKDVKELVNDIIELFKDYVAYYIENTVNEFIEEEGQ
jgi:hypothetical protein